MRQFTAGPNENDMRLSRFVEKVCPVLPLSLLHKGFRKGRVKVNGKKAPAEARLRTGDVVELYINDEFFENRPQYEKKMAKQATTKPQRNAKYPVILYEDENLLLCHKPVGQLSHSGDGSGAAPEESTLLEDIVFYLIDTKQFVPSEEQTFAPALCNRLDRNTEGIVIAAKNAPALRAANALIKEDRIEKEYLAVTVGTPPAGAHSAYLRRDMDKKQVFITTLPAPGAKPIRTGFILLQEKNGLSLVEIRLFTGRTHQIRAHLAFLGAPVLGDPKYGDNAQNLRHKQRQQLLTAHRLRFPALPAEHLLHGLSEKEITLKDSIPQRFFDQLT